MSYQIQLTRRAEKEVLDLDQATFARVKAAIDALVENPRPAGVRKLQGRENEWRIRVGRFRVLYSIEEVSHRVVVHRVTDRKDVYRG